MSTQDTARTYRLGKPTGFKLPTNRYTRSKARFFAAIGGVVAFMVATISFGYSKAALVALVIVAAFEAVVLGEFNGEDAMGLLARRYRLWHNRKYGDLNHHPAPWAAGRTNDGLPVPVAPPPSVGQLTITETTTDQGTPVAVTTIKQERRMVAVMEITGLGGALLDPQDRQTAGDLVSLLISLTQRLTDCNRFSIVARTVGQDLDAHREYVESQTRTTTHPDLITNYAATIDGCQSVGQAQRYYFVVSVSQTVELNRQLMEHAEPGDTAELLYARHMADVVRQIADLIPDARHEVHAILDAAHLSALTRSLIDPHYSPDDVSDASPQTMWPEWDAGKDDLHVTGPYGDTWGRTYWASAFPLNPITGDHFRNLFLLTNAREPITRTVAITADLIPQAEARKTARSDATADTAQVVGDESKGRLGVDNTAASASQARLNDLAPGNASIGLNVVMFTTMQVTDATLMETAHRALLRAGKDAEVVWRPMTGRHDVGAAVTLPFAMGLD